MKDIIFELADLAKGHLEAGREMKIPKEAYRILLPAVFLNIVFLW